MSTLYRKYRPKLWNEVFGQVTVKEILKNQILSNNIAHAYIFAGSRGIGKTTIARLFAKTLNCKNRKPDSIEPCESCESCIAMNNSNSMNLVEIDAASHTGVDDIRELQKITKIAADPSSYKVFIIDEVHMLSKSAFNALLKTLEEPPVNVIFILATTEINKILETVLSRCQIFKFKKASLDEIIEDLNHICKNEKIEIDEDVLKIVAEKSLGGFRDAESMLGQILSLTSDRKITKEIFEKSISKDNNALVLDYCLMIFNKDIKNSLFLVNEVIENNIDINDFIINVLEYFRKVLLYKYNNDCLGNWQNLDEVTKNSIVSMSSGIDFRRLDFIISEFIDCKINIKNSDIIQLPLEISTIRLGENDYKTISDSSKQENSGEDIKGSIGNKIKQFVKPRESVQESSIVQKTQPKTLESTDNIDDMLDILGDDDSKKTINSSASAPVQENKNDKREALMAKFGINKNSLDPNRPSSGPKPVVNSSAQDDVPAPVSEDSMSVLDMLKDEFADEIEK